MMWRNQKTSVLAVGEKVSLLHLTLVGSGHIDETAGSGNYMQIPTSYYQKSDSDI